MLTALIIAFGITLAYAVWLTFRSSILSHKGELEFDKVPEVSPVFEEITLERGENKPAFVFKGRFIGRTPGGHIGIMEAEEGFYVLTNAYLYPQGIYTFAFPSELKGHVRLTKEIVELFRGLKKINAEFGEIVEERLENPLLKEFLIKREEVPVKVVSKRTDEAEIRELQKNKEVAQ